MALSATVHRFAIDLSGRRSRALRSARLCASHSIRPKSLPYLLARTFAYALTYEEGLVFTKGLSTADEPAAWLKDPGGRILLWLDVGTPSADRLHKASKTAERVVVFTHKDPRLLRREAESRAIHDVERIEVYALEPAFLATIEPLVERYTRMQLTRTGGQLYVTVGTATVEGTLVKHALAGG